MADLTAMMQAAAGNAGGDANFIEDVFSTYLYEGNDSTQTINNGIDLAGEGGLVWLKARTITYDNALFDTVRGPTKYVQSNGSDAETISATSLTSFNANGFSIGDNFRFNSGRPFVSWTFRKQPKFFDVVTYTGNGSGGQNIAHNLGSVPGCIIIKRTDTTSNWGVVARTTGALYAFFTGSSQGLNLSAPAEGTFDASPAITATFFQPSYLTGSGGDLNTNGGTYVAYLFAHDAGGFGLSGEDNVISCGSFSHTNGTESVINLGFEPQWLMIKATNASDWWYIVDTMRGWNTTTDDAMLAANVANAESGSSRGQPTSTGFSWPSNSNTQNLIYIAIRRGPMKTPESGTEVFAMDTRGSQSQTVPPGYISNFVVDMHWTREVDNLDQSYIACRLTGDRRLATNSSDAEVTPWPYGGLDYMTGHYDTFSTYSNPHSWMFRRASGFFDVVCYTGDGVSSASARTASISHSLGVAPEMVIIKRRSATSEWIVAGKVNSTTGKKLYLNLTNGSAGDITWATFFNSVDFSINWTPEANFNVTSATYVAYLFATCPGVSKVGSFTGTGTTQVINCGFTSGARFILIKRTDSTGNWYVWDSARGIVAGNDPYLLLNSTAAEVTSTDFIDPAATGFEISSTAPAEINASGGTYIFLAIA
jgi:hypothetical protein